MLANRASKECARHKVAATNAAAALLASTILPRAKARAWTARRERTTKGLGKRHARRATSIAPLGMKALDVAVRQLGAVPLARLANLRAALEVMAACSVVLAGFSQEQALNPARRARRTATKTLSAASAARRVTTSVLQDSCMASAAEAMRGSACAAHAASTRVQVRSNVVACVTLGNSRRQQALRRAMIATAWRSSRTALASTAASS